MTHVWSTVLLNILFFILFVTMPSLVWGQVYLSLGSVNITTNNTEILITDIGEDGDLPRLTCHTDLVNCCRAGDTGGYGGLGEWYYPNGSVVPNIAAGENFYRVRNAPQVVRLARRRGLNPTGSYCCVIPTTEGEMTFCATTESTTMVYLSLGSENITTNNTEILITDIGDDFNLPTLACYTDLVNCCRDVDTGHKGVGHWYYPNGSVVSGKTKFERAKSPSIDFYRVRNVSVVRLARHQGESPIGSYCCVIPTTEGNVTFCANLMNNLNTMSPRQTMATTESTTMTTSSPATVVCPDLPPLTNGVITYSPTSTPRMVGTTAMHRCDTGYRLSGLTTRRCMDNGTSGAWSGTSPICLVDITAQVFPASGHFLLGQSYSLVCIVSGVDHLTPTISYQWFKDSPNQTHVAISSHELLLNPLVLSDAGSYSCQVIVSSALLSDDITVVSTKFILKFSAVNIQLRLKGILNCQQYTLLDPSQKTMDITTALVQGIESLCRCGFNSTFISSPFLKCFENSPQHVTYRAVLSETSQLSSVKIVSDIEQWIRATPDLVVQSVQLGINTTCPLVIVNSGSPECPEAVDARSTSIPVTTQPSDSISVGVVIGVGVAVTVALIAVVILTVVILIVVWYKKSSSSIDVPNNVNSGLKSQTIALNELKQPPLPLVYETIGQPNPAHPQPYEIVEASHEYEDLEKSQKEGDYEKVEPSPPTVDYEITECPAYLPTGVEEGHTHQE